MSGTRSVQPSVGVGGHVEWMTFVAIERLPEPGTISHAQEAFELAAGGGGVAAVQLAQLAGTALMLTARGDDAHGAAAVAQLGERGVEVRAAVRSGARTRRGIAFLDGDHERTITMLDPRLVPHGGDALPWERCAELDAVYFTGGDAAAARAARAAKVLVATTRAADALRASKVELDVLVASASDAGEALDPASLDPAPRVVVLTAGAKGGTWRARDGGEGTWDSVPPPGPPVDAYGCGDSFAAGLTFGLGAGLGLDAALALGARCGAQVLTGRGPYGSMLGAADV